MILSFIILMIGSSSIKRMWLLKVAFFIVDRQIYAECSSFVEPAFHFHLSTERFGLVFHQAQTYALALHRAGVKTLIQSKDLFAMPDQVDTDAVIFYGQTNTVFIFSGLQVDGRRQVGLAVFNGV